MGRVLRNQPLFEEEREKYRLVRRQVADEMPDNPQMGKSAKPRVLLKHVLHSLKLERERQGLTLTELNKRTGIDSGSLSKIEDEQDPNVTMSVLLRYADAIGKTLTVHIEDASITT